MSRRSEVKTLLTGLAMGGAAPVARGPAVALGLER